MSEQQPNVTATAHGPPSVADRLFADASSFDFFQAVRLLERLQPQRRAIGHDGPPSAEVVRLRAHVSLSFPPSSIYDLTAAAVPDGPPEMTVAFMGLTGPSGVLPRHYTELLIHLRYEMKGPERYALRDWLDLFNHRLLALFYRAWEKYRGYLAYERGEPAGLEPDSFTRCLFSLIGLGMPALRRRLRVSVGEARPGQEPERVLDRVEDLALLYYGGALAHRPRCASALEALLQDYVQLPLRLRQFQGQWLRLERENQSQLASGDHNNQPGVNLVAGERVWDVQSKFRIQLGPLGYDRFEAFLPDQAPVPQHKAFFVFCHLVRLYVGPELDFDVQLVLKGAEVPRCQLQTGAAVGPRLGWNTWLCSCPPQRDVADAVFEGQELVRVN